MFAAQVHKGKLHDGTVVAVKVQHAGMHAILSNDIINTERLMSWLNLLEPDFDFKKVRVGRRSKKRVDRNERSSATRCTASICAAMCTPGDGRVGLRNVERAGVQERSCQHDAGVTRVKCAAAVFVPFQTTSATWWCVCPQIRKNLEESGLPVTIPLVVPSLVTSRVLVMQFISGHKLNEFGVLRREGADLRELTALVCDALGYQMYGTLCASSCTTGAWSSKQALLRCRRQVYIWLLQWRSPPWQCSRVNRRVGYRV